MSPPSHKGNWADLSGSNPSVVPLFAGFANRSKIDAIGLFTGQIGYSWNSFLLYAKGGAAVVRDRYESFITPAFGPGVPVGFIADRSDETRWGGAGGRIRPSVHGHQQCPHDLRSGFHRRAQP
ncbi:outer membrane protein [Bradyrhizobium septentrionale]|uniref:Uncharacterized protein n=1 Tax=Bradyrhizobium septentrionale TaxID=1404411 RepID=A0A973W0S4_9BRAD|nr:hypothetical protein [Bradyrhizobium septentrionale]UGY13913.1 hypothetical protein HAP48_0035905 [Bradyrhizobium septentrionale]UGY22468.1 hypothetical protein HU675_0031400 [Bradyrhizobium septentrionale]